MIYNKNLITYNLKFFTYKKGYRVPYVKLKIRMFEINLFIRKKCISY